MIRARAGVLAIACLLAASAADTRAHRARDASGVVTIEIADAAGAPLAGLPLVLMSRDEDWRGIERTDEHGLAHIAFEHVGSHRLHFGDRAHPVRPALDIEVELSVESLGPIVMPPLGDLLVHVVDDDGAPVSGARVEGFGRSGGYVDCVTKPDGTCRATFLPEGEYRIEARHVLSGRGEVSLDFAAGSSASIEIVLRR